MDYRALLTWVTLYTNVHTDQIIRKRLYINCTWRAKARQKFNSLVSERCGSKFKSLLPQNNGMCDHCKLLLSNRMPLNCINEKSTLVQVIAWCRQTTSHYLSQCWPRSLSPFGFTRSEWVNPVNNGKVLLNTFDSVNINLEFRIYDHPHICPCMEFQCEILYFTYTFKDVSLLNN